MDIAPWFHAGGRAQGSVSLPFALHLNDSDNYSEYIAFAWQRCGAGVAVPVLSTQFSVLATGGSPATLKN